MDRVRFDLRDLDKIDVRQRGRLLQPQPLGRSLSSTEHAAGRAAASFAKFVSPSAGYLEEPFKVAERPPKITVIPPASSTPGGSLRVPPMVTVSPVRDITVAVGGAAQAVAVMGVTVAGGVYGSTTPEVGLFGSVGGGWWTNLAASAGVMVAVILGPPSDFAGVSWGIGCDVGFLTGSIGGLLLFSAAGPPFRFLGVEVSLMAGPTAIPVFDVTVQVSVTGLIRLA